MTKTASNTTSLFLESARTKLLEESWPRMRECVESLTEEQVWWRPNEASNSIGNLLLHLNGNVRQWLVAPFIQMEDTRDRPTEFKQREAIPASALLEQLGATLQLASGVLSRLTEKELVTLFDIQGYRQSGLGVVFHVVEHFGMHYGQIVYITKMLRSADLGFYRELDKTGRASQQQIPQG